MLGDGMSTRAGSSRRNKALNHQRATTVTQIHGRICRSSRFHSGSRSNNAYYLHQLWTGPCIKAQQRIPNDRKFGMDQNLFPAMRTTKNSEFEVVTTRNGYRLATSIDGSLTAIGADLIIIDDPLKSIDAYSSMREHVNIWYRDNVPQRLNDMRTGAIIMVQQRLHVSDPTGMLLALPEEWTHLILAAIAKHDEKIFIADNNYYVRRMGEVFSPSGKRLEVLQLLVPTSVRRRLKRIISKLPSY